MTTNTLPCTHPAASSLFDATSGGRVLITHPPVVSEVAYVNLPATVWCVQCTAWVPLTQQQYEHLRSVKA